MRNHLLWKIMLNSLPIIALTILVIWLAIDHLAATYFMRLMENYAIAPHDSHQMFIESVHRYLFWAAFAALVLALLLSYLMTRRVLRPLAQMTRISAELAAGNFTNRVEIVSSDEIGELGKAFNSMADSLDRLERLRKNMVTDLAHELRTPLTNLRGYVEGLGDRVVAPDPETFHMLENEILRLVHLVDDLQQLTKAESAQAFLSRRELSLAELVNNLIPLFSQRFEEKKLQLRVKIEPADLRVRADREKMLQAFSNLLENCWCYASPGAEVEIIAKQQDENVEISICNGGEGISEEDLPYVFERFFRADRSRSRVKGGAGIGLSIVKQLVEAHGGEVGAESTNGWTCIRMILPA